MSRWPDIREPGFWLNGMRIAVIALLIASPVLVFVLIFEGDSLADYFSRIPFESAAWKKAVPFSGEQVRFHMVYNLTHSHILDGKTREEVISLLGNSDGDPAVQGRYPDWQFHYFLGSTRGSLGFDYDYLVLRLDARGRVVATKIVTLHT